MTLPGHVRQESRRMSLPATRLAPVLLMLMATSPGPVAGAMAADLLVSSFVSGQVLRGVLFAGVASHLRDDRVQKFSADGGVPGRLGGHR